MRKNRKFTFEQLVLENKRQLLNDEKAMEEIEKKLEDRILRKAE
ncbi:FbpB family small basic protein [Anoxybacteroides tepidamans]|nr:FbpB family small basic protein [Anoxybacillus tepidamans]